MKSKNDFVEDRLERLEREIKEIKKNIRSDDAKKKFFKSAGSLSDVDTDKIKKDVYDSRSVTSNSRKAKLS